MDTPVPLTPSEAQRETPQPVGEKQHRVLMIAPTSFFADYGCHVRILEEAQILQKLGQKVTIVTYRNGHDVPGLDIRRTLPIPWRQDYEVGSSRHKIAFDALLGWKTMTLLMQERFDVIHAHLHEGALIGEVLGRLFGVPVLFDFQGSLTEEMADHGFLRRESPLFGPALRLETWIDHTAPQIVTSSSHAERLLVERFGCRPEQVHALPDCVNGDTFRPAETYPPEELAALRARLGIPPDRRLLVYLGLLAEHQGISLLLEAVQHLVERGRNLHLLLMGFPNVPVYRQKAQTLGIADRITLTGRIPYHLAPIHLALGDAAVAPKLSNTEAAGKLLNYMAVGLPTVAFDTPVAREYLGLEGLLAKRGDVASLAAQIEASLFPSGDANEFRRRVGGRLRQRALQHFDWQRAGREIVDLYDRLLHPVQTASTPQRSWLATRNK